LNQQVFKQCKNLAQQWLNEKARLRSKKAGMRNKKMPCLIKKAVLRIRKASALLLLSSLCMKKAVMNSFIAARNFM